MSCSRRFSLFDRPQLDNEKLRQGAGIVTWPETPTRFDTTTVPPQPGCVSRSAPSVGNNDRTINCCLIGFAACSCETFFSPFSKSSTPLGVPTLYIRYKPSRSDLAKKSTTQKKRMCSRYANAFTENPMNQLSSTGCQASSSARCRADATASINAWPTDRSRACRHCVCTCRWLDTCPSMSLARSSAAAHATRVSDSLLSASLSSDAC